MTDDLVGTSGFRVEKAQDRPEAVLACEACGKPVRLPGETVNDLPSGVSLVVRCQECAAPPPRRQYRVEVRVLRSVPSDGAQDGQDASDEVMGGFQASTEAETLLGALEGLSVQLSERWERFQDTAKFAEMDD